MWVGCYFSFSDGQIVADSHTCIDSEWAVQVFWQFLAIKFELVNSVFSVYYTQFISY